MSPDASRRALFLDRDGIINEDRGFVHRIEDFVFLDGVFDLVRNARQDGYVPIVVTNQSGIGRGFFSERQFHELTTWMCASFERKEAALERVYHCPYHPEAKLAEYRGDHPWRKPKPGMLLTAQQDFGFDLSASVLVGDQWRDIAAGAAAGIGRLVLVGPAENEARPPGPMPQNLLRVKSVREACDKLLHSKKMNS